MSLREKRKWYLYSPQKERKTKTDVLIFYTLYFTFFKSLLSLVVTTGNLRIDK